MMCDNRISCQKPCSIGIQFIASNICLGGCAAHRLPRFALTKSSQTMCHEDALNRLSIRLGCSVLGMCAIMDRQLFDVL